MEKRKREMENKEKEEENEMKIAKKRTGKEESG